MISSINVRDWVVARLEQSSPAEWWLLTMGVLGAWFNAEGNAVGQLFWLAGNLPATVYYWKRNYALSILFGYYALTCIKGLMHAGALSPLWRN